MEIVHEKPVEHGPEADAGDETDNAWTGEKRRRKHLSPSSSDAPAPAQDHGDPISHATDMEDTVQLGCQGHDLLLTPDHSAQEEESHESFGPHVILSEEDQANYAKLLRPNIPIPPTELNPHMTWEEHNKIQARLARYRIAYYKAVKPECAHELKEPEEYTDDELRKELYFERLEKDESFEWYVHRDDTQNVELNDYQRITPRNFLPHSSNNLYRFHDDYRSRYHTYKIDAVFVKYYAEISNKIKWIVDYLDLDQMSKDWNDMDTRAWRQALRIATGFPDMTVRLAAFAYDEYILEMERHASFKDIDLLYFEIWRFVAKENRSYIGAVKEVYEMDKFHVHKRRLDAEVKGLPVIETIKEAILSIVWMGDIDPSAEEDKAKDLFTKLSLSRYKVMHMAQYAQKKLEIADQLKLDKEDGFLPLRPGMI